MKKLVASLFIVLLAVSLTGCASSKSKQGVRVKCPACGYEFEPANQ